MATISNTAGGSGSQVLGTVTGGITLFNTPNIPNAIFIVYVTVTGTSPGLQGYSTTKTMIGPNTPYMFGDDSSFSGIVSWNWVQMEIS